MDEAHVNEHDFLVWTAGFFDGEGCISLQRRRRDGNVYHRLRINASQNDPEALYRLRAVWGGSVSLYEEKRAAQWTLAETRAREFLEAVAPYLIVKRREAEVALRYVRECARPPGTKNLSRLEVALREQLCDEMMALKDLRRRRRAA
jgi:hypothetical protein